MEILCLHAPAVIDGVDIRVGLGGDWVLLTLTRFLATPPSGEWLSQLSQVWGGNGVRSVCGAQFCWGRGQLSPARVMGSIIPRPSRDGISIPHASEGRGQLSMAWPSCFNTWFNTWLTWATVVTGSVHQHRLQLQQDHGPRCGPRQQRGPSGSVGHADQSHTGCWGGPWTPAWPQMGVQTQAVARPSVVTCIMTSTQIDAATGPWTQT